jgi:aspartate/methionine/tyrosine aminotransferase
MREPHSPIAPFELERFCEALVEAEGVLLLPGTVYAHPGDHFRLGLGRENAPQALERLANFTRRYRVT